MKTNRKLRLAFRIWATIEWPSNRLMGSRRLRFLYRRYIKKPQIAERLDAVRLTEDTDELVEPWLIVGKDSGIGVSLMQRRGMILV